jgi:hypothetical protein
MPAGSWRKCCHLLRLPPPKLQFHSRKIMEVVLCREAEKSTQDKQVISEDNHVAVLVRCIIEAIQSLEAKGYPQNSRGHAKDKPVKSQRIVPVS